MHKYLLLITSVALTPLQAMELPLQDEQSEQVGAEIPMNVMRDTAQLMKALRKSYKRLEKKEEIDPVYRNIMQGEWESLKPHLQELMEKNPEFVERIVETSKGKKRKSPMNIRVELIMKKSCS